MQLKSCVEGCTLLLPEVKFWLVYYAGNLNPEMNFGNLGSWLEGKAWRSTTGKGGPFARQGLWKLHLVHAGRPLVAKASHSERQKW